MGGIGKTELAVQYAWKHLAQQTYPGGVIWLKAREDIATQIVLFARSLPMPQPRDDAELAEKVKFYWRNWQDAETLVILDDVQDYRTIKPLLPVEPHFKILLTTRLTLRSPVQQFEIKVLSEEKAIELLRAIVNQGGETPDPRFLEEVGDLEKQLCHWLGYLPLGLELVGRYLARKRDISLATLWQRLQDKRLKAKALKDVAPEMAAELGVAAAFELSWEVLDASAQQLAARLSLFALAEIPWALVEACLPEADLEALEDLRDEVLLKLHLLERTGQGLYQLHQLLREFFAAKREQMAEADVMKQTLCRVMVVVGQQIPSTPTLKIIKQVTPAIPHLEEVATTLAPWLTDENLISPAKHLAWFYEGQSAYVEALRWSQACLTDAETRLGTNHSDVATSLDNLGHLYYAQGRYGEAEPLCLKALAISEQQLGADHPAVATRLNNLAVLYHAQKRYGEAEPLCRKALAISEQQLGTDHPAVASTLNNLAALYHAQKRYGEAEPLCRKALAISEQQLGTDHPAVASTLNNLAALYRDQGRYGEAEPLCLKALAIGEQQLGADHPAVATRLNNLANLYRDQGRYAEAEPLYLRVLAIGKQHFGADHPNVATSLNNLANLYCDQGRYAEAEPLYLRVLAIGKQHFGADHPNVATSLNNLANLYCDQGRYAEAEPLHLRALAILELHFSADHPDVATSLNNLAGLYKAQGRYGEAEPLYLQALAILVKKLGDDYPNTETVWQNFRGLLQAVMEAGQTGQLSNHPVTQDLLRQLREGSGE
jgi:tetratricopeptide (TPR) repeat protein